MPHTAKAGRGGEVQVPAMKSGARRGEAIVPSRTRQPRSISSDLLCDAEGCTCVIGYERHGKDHWFDGTHQVGYNSYCSERHLRSEWKWNNGNNTFIKWKG